ncbi:MAG: hypothetical protein ACI8P0_001129 [Planctomycetaceae bacterium]|jgi:hypothetical protein
MTQQVLIEQIVQEVMRRLMPNSATAPVSPETNNGRSAQLTDSIVTADLLAEKSAGRTQISVTSKAVVTPSARDWLRHNKVELIRSVASGTAPHAKESDRLVITHSSDQTIDRVLEDAARPANGGWKRKSVGSADEAAKKVIGEFRRESSRVIVVLTSEPEVAACLANRNEKVRAAVVADAAAVVRVKSGLDGNVFVVDPTGRSFFELRNILRRIES